MAKAKKGHIRKAFSLLWGSDLRKSPFYIKLPLSFVRLVVAVLRDLKDGDLRLRATSLVYTTLLSLAPLLALSFSLMKGLGMHSQIEPVVIGMLEPLGDKGLEIAEKIIGFVANVKVGVLGAVGFSFLIYSVVTLMNEIEKAMNDIWRIRKKRPFALRIRDNLSVLFIGPSLMFVSMMITASLRHASFLEEWVGRELFEGALTFVGTFTAWALFAVAFAALYMFIPYTKVRLMPALVAGAVTGLMWKTLGWVFSAFIAGSSNYAAIYSAFAALVLFIIWLYIAWLVVLIGTSICFYIQNPSNQSLPRKFKNLSLRVKEKIALQICVEVGDAFYKDKPSPDLQELSRNMFIPIAAVEDVVDDLIEVGFIAQAGKKEFGFIPAKPFEDVSVDDMLKALRASDESGNLSFAHVKVSKTVEDVLQKGEDASHHALGKMTLKKVST